MGKPVPIIAVMTTLTCCMVLSCNTVSPAYNRENIKATWILDTYDGVLQDERDFTVMTFDASGAVRYEGVLSLEDANFQWGQNGLYYETYCCDLSITGSFEGMFGHVSRIRTSQQYTYQHSEDSLMTLALESYSLDGEDVTAVQYSNMTMRKLPRTYAQADSIQGIWQFNTRNGSDFSDCRLQIGASNALTVLRRTGENTWTPMGGVTDSTDSTASTVYADYYNLYHDFIALTVYDNDILGTAGKWDVKCFTIDSVSILNGRMYLQSSGDTYGLSFISSLSSN